MPTRHLASLLCLALLLSCGKREAPVEPSAGVSEESAGPPWRPGYVRPGVVDIHGHVPPSGLHRLPRVMEDNGVAWMVNLSGGVLGRGAEAIGAVQRAHPRLLHFLNIDWRRRGLEGFGELMAESLEIAVKRFGFRGLKVSKALGLYLDDVHGQRIPVDWPELAPLWDKAGELGVPVAIHTGDPKAFWLPVTPANERYAELSLHPTWSYADPSFPSREQLLAERDRLLARHPKTTFICVHFGNNPEDIDYVDGLLNRFPNAVVDVAARLGEIGRHPPDKVREVFIRHKTRILFGTDLGLTQDTIMLGSVGEEDPTEDDVKPFYDAHWRFFEGRERGIPHPTPIQGAWTIDAIDLPDDVLDHLYYKNAARLLKLEP